jgi:hypothetical protein
MMSLRICQQFAAYSNAMHGRSIAPAAHQLHREGREGTKEQYTKFQFFKIEGTAQVRQAALMYVPFVISLPSW